MTRTYRVKCWYGDRQCSITDFDARDNAFNYAREQSKAMPRWYYSVEIIYLEEKLLGTYNNNLDQGVTVRGIVS